MTYFRQLCLRIIKSDKARMVTHLKIGIGTCLFECLSFYTITAKVLVRADKKMISL